MPLRLLPLEGDRQLVKCTNFATSLVPALALTKCFQFARPHVIAANMAADTWAQQKLRTVLLILASPNRVDQIQGATCKPLPIEGSMVASSGGSIVWQDIALVTLGATDGCAWSGLCERAVPSFLSRSCLGLINQALNSTRLACAVCANNSHIIQMHPFTICGGGGSDGSRISWNSMHCCYAAMAAVAPIASASNAQC